MGAGQRATEHARLVPELLVTSIETSLDYYLRLCGFRVLYDRPEDGFAYLDLDGAQLMLEEADPGDTGERAWWTARPERPYGRGMNLQIEVADVGSIHQRLAAAGWPLYRPMEEAWYRSGDEETGNRQLLVQDPDGYLLRFFSHLGLRPRR